MSLNKFRDYDKYELVNIEAKANKLGLKSGTDDYPVCLSNTADKQLITRKLTSNDFDGIIFNGGEQTFYNQIQSKINIMNTADANVEMFNDNISYGSRTFDGSDIGIGDFIKIKANGFYNTRSGAGEILRGVFVRLNDGTTNNDFEVYQANPPGPTPTRSGIFFPEAPLNNSKSFWEIEIILKKVADNGIPNNTELSYVYKVWGNTNFTTNYYNFNAIANRENPIASAGLTYGPNMTIKSNWKAYGEPTFLNPDFQIYTEQYYVSKVVGVSNV